MDRLDFIIDKALDVHFNALKNFGYHSYESVYKILFLILLDEFTDEFSEILTDDEKLLLERILSCIQGSECMVPIVGNC